MYYTKMIFASRFPVSFQFDREHFSEVFTDLKWFESKVGNKYLNEAAGLAAEKEAASRESRKTEVGMQQWEHSFSFPAAIVHLARQWFTFSFYINVIPVGPCPRSGSPDPVRRHKRRKSSCGRWWRGRGWSLWNGVQTVQTHVLHEQDRRGCGVWVSVHI